VRRGCALPLREYLWVALLAAGFALTFVCAALWLRQAFPSRPLQFTANCTEEKTEALILGDSQLTAILPKNLDVPVQNRALPGSDYEIQNLIFQAMLPKMPELKVLVLGFDNLALLTPSIQKRAGDYSDYYRMGVPVGGLPRVSFYDELQAAVRHQRWLKSMLIGPKYTITWPKKTAQAPVEPPPARSPAPGYQYLPEQGAEKANSYHKSLRPKGRNNEENNLRAFTQILETCKARGIFVALLRPPVSRSYFEARPAEWDEQMGRLHTLVTSILPPEQFAVWDEQTGLACRDEDMLDPNHTHPLRYTQYTANIGERLRAVLPSSRAAS